MSNELSLTERIGENIARLNLLSAHIIDIIVADIRRTALVSILDRELYQSIIDIGTISRTILANINIDRHHILASTITSTSNPELATSISAINAVIRYIYDRIESQTSDMSDDDIVADRLTEQEQEYEQLRERMDERRRLMQQ